MSLVPAHHDDPDVKFSRPFLAGVLALCTDEAVILLSGIDPLFIPRSKLTQSPAVRNKLKKNKGTNGQTDEHVVFYFG